MSDECSSAGRAVAGDARLLFASANHSAGRSWHARLPAILLGHLLRDCPGTRHPTEDHLLVAVPELTSWLYCTPAWVGYMSRNMSTAVYCLQELPEGFPCCGSWCELEDFAKHQAKGRQPQALVVSFVQHSLLQTKALLLF